MQTTQLFAICHWKQPRFSLFANNQATYIEAIALLEKVDKNRNVNEYLLMRWRESYISWKFHSTPSTNIHWNLNFRVIIRTVYLWPVLYLQKNLFHPTLVYTYSTVYIYWCSSSQLWFLLKKKPAEEKFSNKCSFTRSKLQSFILTFLPPKGRNIDVI